MEKTIKINLFTRIFLLKQCEQDSVINISETMQSIVSKDYKASRLKYHALLCACREIGKIRV